MDPARSSEEMALHYRRQCSIRNRPLPFLDTDLIVGQTQPFGRKKKKVAELMIV